MQNSYNKEKIISKDNLEPRIKVIKNIPKYLKYKKGSAYWVIFD